jgi:hypothetical protein
MGNPNISNLAMLLVVQKEKFEIRNPKFEINRARNERNLFGRAASGICFRISSFEFRVFPLPRP